MDVVLDERTEGATRSRQSGGWKREIRRVGTDWPSSRRPRSEECGTTTRAGRTRVRRHPMLASARATHSRGGTTATSPPATTPFRRRRSCKTARAHTLATTHTRTPKWVRAHTRTDARTHPHVYVRRAGPPPFVPHHQRVRAYADGGCVRTYVLRARTPRSCACVTPRVFADRDRDRRPRRRGTSLSLGRLNDGSSAPRSASPERSRTRTTPPHTLTYTRATHSRSRTVARPPSFESKARARPRRYKTHPVGVVHGNCRRFARELLRYFRA